MAVFSVLKANYSNKQNTLSRFKILGAMVAPCLMGAVVAPCLMGAVVAPCLMDAVVAPLLGLFLALVYVASFVLVVYAEGPRFHADVVLALEKKKKK